MFEPSSRYVLLTVKSLDVIGWDGNTRQIRYVERRFLPPLGANTTLLEHIVAQGERLDNVTAKYLADPTQFWRVADANDTMRPEELTEETVVLSGGTKPVVKNIAVGRRIVIPLSH